MSRHEDVQQPTLDTMPESPTTQPKLQKDPEQQHEFQGNPVNRQISTLDPNLVWFRVGLSRVHTPTDGTDRVNRKATRPIHSNSAMLAKPLFASLCVCRSFGSSLFLLVRPPTLFVESKQLIHVDAVYSPANADIAKEFGISEIAARVAQAIYLIGFSFGPVILVPIGEDYGRKPLFTICLILTWVFQIPCALAPNYATLVVFRLFAGIVSS